MSLARASVLVLCTSALLLLGALCCEAERISISQDHAISGQRITDLELDFTAMTGATSDVSVTVTDVELTGNGLALTAFEDVPGDSVRKVSLILANFIVDDTTITLTGCFPRRSRFDTSYIVAAMKRDIPLFRFHKVNLKYDTIINIVDTIATWPVTGAGGDLFVLTGNVPLTPQFRSAIYITRAQANYARHIWFSQFVDETTVYFVDVLHNSMLAIDYVTCYRCKGAFVYSASSTPPIVGSENHLVRFSNCTNDGPEPFWGSPSATTFSIGPQGGNLILSGITTAGPFFGFTNSQASGQVKRYTKFTFMHIKAASSGLTTDVPFYNYEGNSVIEQVHVYMGNITFRNKLLRTVDDYRTARLAPMFLVDAFSKFISLGTKIPEYSNYAYREVGVVTDAFCQQIVERDGYDVAYDLGTEYMQQGTARWTRPECRCRPGRYAPYCTLTYDPLLYYAGFTLNPMACKVENCAQCRWGRDDQCTKCSAGFMLHPSTFGCVPNICGTCPDDGQRYTYVGGNCVLNTVPHCVTVDAEGACTLCESYYTLYRGNCVSCNQPNCALCSTADWCIECASDQAYNIDPTAGTCVYCTPHCSRCNLNSCTACEDGHSLDREGVCQPLCAIPNCLRCQSATECAECSPNVVLRNGQCTCDIAHCETCFNERCKQCEEGYIYSIDTNTCIPIILNASDHPPVVVMKKTMALMLIFSLVFNLY